MKLISSWATGDFKLIVDGQETAALKYANWLSGKAKAVVKGDEIEIKAKGIWSSTFEIYKNGISAGDITYNISGNMIIRIVRTDGKELKYSLKNSGIWKLSFEVYNEDEQLQFSLITSGKWNKLNYDYEVEMADFDSEIDIEELLIYCGYATNLYLAITSAT